MESRPGLPFATLPVQNFYSNGDVEGGGRFSGPRFLPVHSFGDNTVLLDSSIPLGQLTGECGTAGMKVSASNSQTAVLGQNRPIQERISAPSGGV